MLLFLFSEFDIDISVILKEEFPMKISTLMFIFILPFVNLLVVFRGVHKDIINFVMSLRLYKKNSALTGRIFMRFNFPPPP